MKIDHLPGVRSVEEAEALFLDDPIAEESIRFRIAHTAMADMDENRRTVIALGHERRARGIVQAAPRRLKELFAEVGGTVDAEVTAGRLEGTTAKVTEANITVLQKAWRLTGKYDGLGGRMLSLADVRLSTPESATHLTYFDMDGTIIGTAKSNWSRASKFGLPPMPLVHDSLEAFRLDPRIPSMQVLAARTRLKSGLPTTLQLLDPKYGEEDREGAPETIRLRDRFSRGVEYVGAVIKQWPHPFNPHARKLSHIAEEQAAKQERTDGSPLPAILVDNKPHKLAGEAAKIYLAKEPNESRLASVGNLVIVGFGGKWEDMYGAVKESVSDPEIGLTMDVIEGEMALRLSGPNGAGPTTILSMPEHGTDIAQHVLGQIHEIAATS